jgi:hypothetical protein
VLIHGNYLSPRDIEICLGFDIGSLATHTEYKNIRGLHDALLAEYRSDDESGAAQPAIG